MTGEWMNLDSPLIALLRSAYSKLLDRFSTSILLFCLRVEAVSSAKECFKLTNCPLLNWLQDYFKRICATPCCVLLSVHRAECRATMESKTPCCSFNSHVAKYLQGVLGYVGSSSISDFSAKFQQSPMEPYAIGCARHEWRQCVASFLANWCH